MEAIYEGTKRTTRRKKEENRRGKIGLVISF